RPRRSHPARGAALAQRGQPASERAGRASRHVAARLHEASEGPGECGAHNPLQGGPRGALHPACGAYAGGAHVARVLREGLGRAARCARAVATAARGDGPMDISAIKERPSLTFVRRFAAPPERVWRAWTEPAALKQWFGPADQPVASAELDVRVGGRFRI